MDFKFKRLMDLLGHGIRGRTVLAVCCGSGMDAEYLASSGAIVTALDISAGCLRRARDRRTRFQIAYELVQADVEHLPFADASFDYSFVHDGLHHLTEYTSAVREMARVAKAGILLSEPAKAAVTSIPTTLGLLRASEEAGNRVNRIDQHRMATLLRSAGFDRVRSGRFLLKYGHPPASWWRRMDSTPLQQLARVLVREVGATALSPLGNKLVMVGERTAAQTH